MTRLGVVFWSGLVLASGFATFSVKYAVQGIDDELARVRKQTTAEQQEARVLTAEWAYLNQPERLADLNRTFLQLAPLTAKQMQRRIEDIALRAPAAPAPDTLIAMAPTAPRAVASIAHGAGAPTAAAPASAEPVAVESVGMPAETAGFGEIQPAQAQGAQQTAVKLAEFHPGGMPARDMRADAAAALAEARRLLGADAGGQAARVRLAKAAPGSLDALISQIADKH
jgi:hypothetical protein